MNFHVEQVNSGKPKESKRFIEKEKEKEKEVLPEIAEQKSVEAFDKLEGKEVALAFNYELIESYFDGLSTYLLLKIREGAVACYMVAQVGSGESANMFILPAEYLSAGALVTSVLLRVGLLNSETPHFDH